MNKLITLMLVLIFAIHTELPAQNKDDKLAVIALCKKKHPQDTVSFLRVLSGKRVYAWYHDTVYVQGKVLRLDSDSIFIDTLNYAVKDLQLISPFTKLKRVMLGGGIIVITAASALLPFSQVSIAFLIISAGSLSTAAIINNTYLDMETYSYMTVDNYKKLKTEHKLRKMLRMAKKKNN